MAFHSLRKVWLFWTSASRRPPTALIWKKKALRWSWKVSMTMAMRSSEPRSASRTIWVAISFSGSRS